MTWSLKRASARKRFAIAFTLSLSLPRHGIKLSHNVIASPLECCTLSKGVETAGASLAVIPAQAGIQFFLLDSGSRPAALPGMTGCQQCPAEAEEFVARQRSDLVFAGDCFVAEPALSVTQPVLSEVEGLCIKFFACFDFALRATLSMNGVGRQGANVVWFDLA